MTPLHHAASMGHVDTVALLVSSGANITAVTEVGIAALVRVCMNFQYLVLKHTLYIHACTHFKECRLIKKMFRGQCTGCRRLCLVPLT